MLVNLENLEDNQILSRHPDVAQLEVETVSGTLVVENLDASFKFRLDPQGYLMSYEISGTGQLPCSRCGNDLVTEIKCSDLAGLRVKQPEDQHLVLDHSEMNVFFLENKTVDLIRVLKEVIELELPAYPRHEDGDPQCEIAGLAEEQAQDQSPFGSLAKYLDD